MTLPAVERGDAEPESGAAVRDEPAERRNAGKPFRRVLYDTRFDRFLVRESIRLDALVAATGIARTNLGRLREGRHEPRQSTIVRLVHALRKITGEPIYASDLFYLGEAEDDDTFEAKEFLASADART